MRALLVGCGNMAAGWARAINSNDLLKGRIEIVGLVEPVAETAKAYAAAHGFHAAQIFSEIGPALGATNPDIVFDITPPDARAGVVQAALNSGAHVLSEKPMAASLSDARTLAAVADAADRRFCVIQNRRYKKSIRRIKAFLASGALGEITGLHADFFLGARFGGFRDHMAHVLLLDMAIHHFDAARFMSGLNARRVHCVETNPKGSWYDRDASAFATFEMENDVVFSYRGSWCAEGANTSWEAAWRITGSKGTLIWDGEDGIEARLGHGEVEFIRETVPAEIPDPVSEDELHEHASVIAAFLEAVETGKRAETDSSDNLNSIAMVFGAIKSAETGQAVDLDKEMTNA